MPGVAQMTKQPGSPQRAYPRDEFDDLPAPEGRRGAHRARPHPVIAMLPVLLVVVAVVALVVGALTVLDGGAPDPGTPPVPGAVPTEPVPGEPVPAEGAATEPAATEPAATEPAATEPAATQTAAPVDPDVPVTVLNGTLTSGLAGQATELLRAEGWTIPSAGNYREGETPPTTVYYPREDLAATAEAVAEDLGGAATELSEGFDGEGLTVVLGEDFQP